MHVYTKNKCVTRYRHAYIDDVHSTSTFIRNYFIDVAVVEQGSDEEAEYKSNRAKEEEAWRANAEKETRRD